MLAETRALLCVGGFSVEGGNSLPEPCRKDEKDGKRGEGEKKLNIPQNESRKEMKRKEEAIAIFHRDFIKTIKTF